MAELTVDELGWLLGVAALKRRKHERELAKAQPKAGQPREEYYAFRQAKIRATQWARDVEDHLILLLHERDPDYTYRAGHRERLAELLAGQDGCVCPGPDTCAGPPCRSAAA